MDNRFINYYKSIAESTANLSRARRAKVGAIIVKNDNIISFGYNGTPSGEDNNCEDETEIHCPDLTKRIQEFVIRKRIPKENITDLGFGYYDRDLAKSFIIKQHGNYKWCHLTTKPNVIHAEINALKKVRILLSDTFNAEMFITHAPCSSCVDEIVSAGIKSVYYVRDYGNSLGINRLLNKNINVCKI